MIAELGAVRRVLMVNKFQYAKGGAELYMYGLAGLLEREGVDVRYFGMRHPRNVDSDTSRHYVSEIDFEQPPPGIGGCGWPPGPSTRSRLGGGCPA